MNTKISSNLVVALIFIVLIVFLHRTAVVASHWTECRFEVIVVDISESHLTIDILRFAGGDGSAIMDEHSCLKKAGDMKIPVETIAEGIDLLVPGAILQGQWFEYGAMTPNGPVLHRGWSFASPDRP